MPNKNKRKAKKEPKPKMEPVKKEEAFALYNQIVCDNYKEFQEKVLQFIALAKPKVQG